MHHHGWTNGSETQPSIPKLHFVSHLTLRDTRGGNQEHLNGVVEERYARKKHDRPLTRRPHLRKRRLKTILTSVAYTYGFKTSHH